MNFDTEDKVPDKENLKKEYFIPLRQIIQKAVNQLILIRGGVRGQPGEGEGHGDHYGIREVLNRQRRKRIPLTVHMMKYRNIADVKSPAKQILKTIPDWNQCRKLLSCNSISGARLFDPNFLMERMTSRILTANLVDMLSSRGKFKMILEQILSDMNGKLTGNNDKTRKLNLTEIMPEEEVEEFAGSEFTGSVFKTESNLSKNLDKDREEEVPTWLNRLLDLHQEYNVQQLSQEKQTDIVTVSMETTKYENEDNKSSNNKIRETTGNGVHVEIDVMDDGDFIKRLDHRVSSTSAPTILCHVTPVPLPEVVTDDEYFTPGEELNPVISPSFYTPPNGITPNDSITSRFVFGEKSLVPVLSQESVEFLSTERDGFILVGRGTYGCVYLVNVIGHDHVACVKEFFPEMTSPEDVAREAMILNYLQDTGVVPKFYGILMNEEELSLVQDFYGNGMTLKDLLFKRSLQWNPVEIIELLSELASGLLKIHRKYVFCNDVKADNILVDSNNKNKIVFIDFGVATYKAGRCFHVPGQSRVYSHLAPEVRAGKPTSTASDVYSLGHLMTSILEFYPGVACRVPSLAEVVRSCLDVCPALRPNLEEIITVSQHALKSFNNINTIYKNE